MCYVYSHLQCVIARTKNESNDSVLHTDSLIFSVSLSGQQRDKKARETSGVRRRGAELKIGSIAEGCMILVNFQQL